MFGEMSIIGLMASEIAMNSCLIITTRCLGMSGLMKSEPDEHVVMLTEKIEACSSSMSGAMIGMMNMRSPGEIAYLALAPYHDRTSANVTRLCSNRS